MKAFIVNLLLDSSYFLAFQPESFVIIPCGDKCIKVIYTTNYAVNDEGQVRISDGTRFERLYDEFTAGPEAFAIDDAHINIISGFYEEVKFNHFANAPVGTLQDATESFSVEIFPEFEFEGTPVV